MGVGSNNAHDEDHDGNRGVEATCYARNRTLNLFAVFDIATVVAEASSVLAVFHAAWCVVVETGEALVC